VLIECKETAENCGDFSIRKITSGVHGLPLSRVCICYLKVLHNSWCECAGYEDVTSASVITSINYWCNLCFYFV